MLNENEKDVNVEEEVTPSPSPEDQAPVNDQPDAEPDASAEDAAPQEPDQQEPVAPVHTPAQPAVEAVDENGVPWKNRAIEAARKLESLQETKTIVKQSVEEALQSQNKQPVYTKEHIPQLRAYAKENPQYAEWVENTIEDIRQREVQNTIQTEISKADKTRADNQTRQQAEAWITTDPYFKNCFVDTPQGKQWNQADPLAQLVIQILNSPDPMTGKLVKDRPDAFYIAADLAYGRYARMNNAKSTTQVTQLRKDLRKAQKQTMVPAGGKVPSTAPVRRPVQKALDNFKKTNSKADLQDATRAYLSGNGLIKEE